MGTRYVGTPGAIGDFTIRQSVVRLDEAIGRVEDSLSRVVQNNVFQEIESPGEEGTSLKVNGHLRLRDNKFLYWAPKGINNVAQRSAGIRWHVKGVDPDRMEFDVKTGTKMVMNKDGQVGIGTVAPTSGYLLDVVSTTGQGIRLQPSSASLTVLGETSGGEASFAQFGSSATATNSFTSWGMANATTLATATAAWGLKMRKNTFNSQKNGLSLEVIGDDATPGAANTGLYGELLYISTVGRWSVTDRLIGSSNANQRYSGYLMTLAPVGGSVGTLQLRRTTAGGVTDVFEVTDSGGTPQAVCTSAFLWGFGEDIPLNRVDVSGAQVIGSAYSGVITAPTNGLMVQGQVGFNITAAIAARQLSIGVSNDTVGIVMVPDSGATTARPQLQWWQDAASTTAFSIGNCLPTTGGTLTSLVFHSYASATWTERMRLVNATGDLLIGTTTDSARLTVQGADNALAFRLAGGSTTGAGTTGAFSGSGTWNTSGSPTAWLWNQTNTSSGNAALLFDWQVGASSRLSLGKQGNLTQGHFPESSGSNFAHLITTQIPLAGTGTYSALFWQPLGVGGGSLSGSPDIVGLSFDMSALSGSATTLYGANFSAAPVGLGSGEISAVRIIVSPSDGTCPTVRGLDVQVGDNVGLYSAPMSVSDYVGLHIRDNDTGDPWGNGSAPTNQYGLLVGPTASGTTNYHAVAVDGNINIRRDQYFWWGQNPNTALASRDAGIRWKNSTTALIFDTGATDRLELTSAALYPSTNGGLTLGKDDNAWSEAWFKDTGASHQHRLLFNSTGIAGDLVLTFDLNNGSRNLVLKGDVNTNVYTPTLFNTTNVAASTAYSCQWLRVGDMITVSGLVDIDPTAGSSATVLGMSLPVSSNIGAVEDCAGVACTADSIYFAAITGDAANNRATFSYTTNAVPDIGNKTFSFTFTYQII